MKSFDEWAEDYGLDYEPLDSVAGRRADCEAAWLKATEETLKSKTADLQKAITEGLKEYTAWVAMLIMIIFFINIAINMTPWFKNSTDKQGWFELDSGLTIYRDQLSGCQYLETKQGLTPRILYGDHFGCEKIN